MWKPRLGMAVLPTQQKHTVYTECVNDPKPTLAVTKLRNRTHLYFKRVIVSDLPGHCEQGEGHFTC